ncbi:MAG: A/G-specific adenine glycosylase [Nitrososphaerales archaeon]
MTHIPDLTNLAARLLDWMQLARRDLPWRRNRTPYAVWISEVMLQQTQVATVVPYFERWLERFPGVTALATAPLDDVLKLWEGLGYYARARNLQRAAQAMVERHGGRVPCDRRSLLALPGIGRYTAGAILSMAFGQPEPVLDGNVRRVLCRLYDVEGDPRAPEVEERLWQLSAALVQAAPGGRAGDFNEALIELGALVCTPAAPDCPNCPIRQYCLAYQRDTTGLRPAKRTRPVTPYYDVVAAVVRNRDGQVLIVQRPPQGLLGGLWGFPGGTVAPDEDLVDAVARTVEEQTGLTVSARAAVRRVKHAYTHFRITLHAFTAAIEAGEARALTCAQVRWVAVEELEDYPFPVTDRSIAREIAHR